MSRRRARHGSTCAGLADVVLVRKQNRNAIDRPDAELPRGQQMALQMRMRSIDLRSTATFMTVR